MPYDPVIPSSSQCSTFTSESIYTELSSASSAPAAESNATSAAATTGTGTGAGPATTGAPTTTRGQAPANNAAPTTKDGNGAGVQNKPVVVALAGMVGVLGVAMLL